MHGDADECKDCDNQRLTLVRIRLGEFRLVGHARILANRRVPASGNGLIAYRASVVVAGLLTKPPTLTGTISFSRAPQALETCGRSKMWAQVTHA